MRDDLKPDDAWWDPSEKEWVHGAKDAQGRLVGEVRYWDPNGSLISTADHVDGRPHGTARRFIAGAMTQECTYVHGEINGVRRFVRPAPELDRCSESVVAYECVYENGDLIGTTYRSSDGHEVDGNGRELRKRPPNIPATASQFPSSGWLWMRRRGERGEVTLESWEYYEDGTPKLSQIGGEERRYYANGVLAVEGKRENHRQVGAWRIYDAAGVLRRIERYDNGTEERREWHRTADEAQGHALVREGPIDQRQEVGRWGDLSLGPSTSDESLLARELGGAYLDKDYAATDASVLAMLARARRAGIAGDIAELGLADGPAWLAVSDKGELIPLRSAGASYDSPIRRCLTAMRWGPPDGPLLAQLADALFRADRAQAALDVIDAALLLGSEPLWTISRNAYLRATGQPPEIESSLDDRACTLLEEIRRNPDDDAPRLVFADHIADAHPAHAAVITAQCTGRADQGIVDLFVASLPEWLREVPERGFIEGFRYAEAKHFVTADPDLLYRVAPSCRSIELQYASPYIAQLVTLPWLRRFVDLSFHDTYISLVPAQQLARCTHLDDLEHLGLWDTGLDDEELQALCAGPAYPRLQSIDIGHHRDSMSYGLAGLAAVGDAAFAKTLRSLHLTNRWLGDGIVDILAKLPALVDLDLTNGNVTDDGANRLLDLPNEWTSLVLTGSDVSEGMQGTFTARFGDRVRFTRS